MGALVCVAAPGPAEAECDSEGLAVGLRSLQLTRQVGRLRQVVLRVPFDLRRNSRTLSESVLTGNERIEKVRVRSKSSD